VTRLRWLALCFALGSTCFLVGPFPGYLQLVGGAADASTFFVGSILFTAGGALQSWLAWDQWRSAESGGRAAWWSAIVQSAGTLFFNVTTYQAVHTSLSDASYDRVVWRPDAFGSVCFLVSGVIAYRVSARHGWLPARGEAGWWEPSVNLLGCVFFGIAAIAGYVVPAHGTPVDLAAANVTTVLGALCFFACAAATLRTGHTLKSPRLRRLRALGHRHAGRQPEPMLPRSSSRT
jgi:hypothetical protein